MPPLIIMLIVFFAIVFVVGILGVVSSSIKHKQNEQRQREYSERYHSQKSMSNVTKSTTSSGLNDHQRSYISSLREKQAEKHAQHVADAHKHAHLGEEEHYDEIVGSLGEVNDEGCADLNGVRFVAHDLAYEIRENEQPDYNKLAQAIVLGEVLNNPRFKSPHSPKK